MSSFSSFSISSLRLTSLADLRRRRPDDLEDLQQLVRLRVVLLPQLVHRLLHGRQRQREAGASGEERRRLPNPGLESLQQLRLRVRLRRRDYEDAADRPHVHGEGVVFLRRSELTRLPPE